MPSDGVIRRVSDQQVVTDKAGKRRVSSIAFKPASTNGGMSVDLERQIVDAKLDPKVYVTTPRWVGSVRFTAGDLRNEGLQVGFHPLPDNPHHGEVWGLSGKHPQRLRELAVWYVEIADVGL